MHARIQTALTQLEATHNIRILYACESGSRAWGFPSPDSDYDVRFLYAHPSAWYLTLDEGPDTLNFPVDEELDLAGWELRKALKLLRGSNAALFEWLQSPVVYREAAGFRAALEPLLPACWNPRAGLHHYLGQLRRGVEEDLAGEQVRLKRLFYALRSALAAHWIQRHPDQIPPMEFALLRELLPSTLDGVVEELLAHKATADEKTTVPRPPALVAFLQQEYAVGQAARATLPIPRHPEPTPALNTVFRAWLQPQP
ncbi:nucleotidyltransferase domain-containing protein [Microvirga sp. STR05]|uniref:Nucleotidyltransferase domain-containing protein n=1 Tax=Hymenobacter duratus TaxID=2771356 RepID=A0ABR8JKI9_9BACT|nr:nucleotidyltransferase domain-containing protein [Hymenobacter duratus]MBD2716088.1 nucleotidyltransferase domain-containing protein [Hymenobacter duratus]MBR7951002.1 nucleotidyltransferase domain-containing protein [Microvirga sp. STR05]